MKRTLTLSILLLVLGGCSKETPTTELSYSEFISLVEANQVLSVEFSADNYTLKGKTANGAIWLNANLCSPWDYWQFWRNTEDKDVIRFLKLFTEISLYEIKKLETAFQINQVINLSPYDKDHAMVIATPLT